MLTEDVFTHASIEQASSHRATINDQGRASTVIEPASRATASSQHRAFSKHVSASTIEHRGAGAQPGVGVVHLLQRCRNIL